MITALIVAAGEGTRIGAKIPKPYIKLKGMPILAVTVKSFNSHPEIDNIVIVTNPNWIDYCKTDIVGKYGFNKVKSIIEGGKTRQDSVRFGLSAMSDAPVSSIILIHDGVRPFITQKFISMLIQTAKKYDAVVPAVPVTNTIKEIKNGFVSHTLDRDRLYEIQTPQVFRLNVIKNAHNSAVKAKFHTTDDSALVERLGVRVKVVEGLTQNIKITTKENLLYAEKILI